MACHLDSVNAGPGINDNGSGSAALLEIGQQPGKVKPQNTIRLAWWGAEEANLVGSTYYINNLPQADRDKIALYLNFDMIGSPNHIFGIYDGDDSDGVGSGPGPQGSAQIESTFEEFFEMRGLPYKGTDFTGRSDYGPFIAIGIPSGGLFTGAEGIKTAEEAALFGGTAGLAYDPCYHQACDTYANVNDDALEANSDAVAYAVLSYAMNTSLINGEKSKGNFRRLRSTLQLLCDRRPTEGVGVSHSGALGPFRLSPNSPCRMPLGSLSRTPRGAPPVRHTRWVRVAVVANPVRDPAGRVAAAVESACRSRGWPTPTIRTTTIEDPGAGQAGAAVAEGAELVVVCGGDGTVREAASALAGTGVAMGIVPRGTANLYARNLRLPLGSVEGSSTSHSTESPTMDLGRARWGRRDGQVAEGAFVVLAGIGHDARTVELVRPP